MTCIVTEARDIAREIATRRLGNPLTSDFDRKLVATLLRLYQDTRLYLYNTKELAIELWDELREQDVVFDYLTACTIEFRLRMPVGTSGYDALVQRLATAYVCLSDGEGVVDPETIERLPQSNTYHQLLVKNPWLVFLLTLETTDLFKELLDA